MEIRARYAQMGAFTLAVLAAGFAFVYWLNNAAGFGQRAVYQVVFDSPVSGLLRGSAVLFNGIRVGEVTSLTLDPVNPKRVRATIAIESGTPVAHDTSVGMDFQGLTGAPVIALNGGTSTTPLALTSGEAPVLVADPASTQSMSRAARDVLHRFEVILSENTEPLKIMIGNLEKFSGALARNSDKLDGIVAGIERMTGGGSSKTKPAVFDLAVPAVPSLEGTAADVQLIVPDPSALTALDNERMQVAAADGALAALPGGQWSDVLSKMVQMKLIRSIEDSRAFAGVSRPLEGFGADFQLLIDIRKFQVVEAQGRAAVIEIAGKISDSNGRIVATKVFANRIAVATQEAAAALAAFDEAFRPVAQDLVTWAAKTVAAANAAKVPAPEPMPPAPRKKSGTPFQ